MPAKRLLTISMSLPLIAMSASAYAGSTISDKSYWLSEAKQSAQAGIVARGDVNPAFAYDRTAPRLQPQTTTNNAAAGSRYQGGPKSH
jgi:hypothetical protein